MVLSWIGGVKKPFTCRRKRSSFTTSASATGIIVLFFRRLAVFHRCDAEHRRYASLARGLPVHFAFSACTAKLAIPGAPVLRGAWPVPSDGRRYDHLGLVPAHSHRRTSLLPTHPLPALEETFFSGSSSSEVAPSGPKASPVSCSTLSSSNVPSRSLTPSGWCCSDSGFIETPFRLPSEDV